MDRRTFLRRALSLAPAAIIVPPAVSYFLPPRGGWIVPGYAPMAFYADRIWWTDGQTLHASAPMTATEVLMRQREMEERWAKLMANPPLIADLFDLKVAFREYNALVSGMRA